MPDNDYNILNPHHPPCPTLPHLLNNKASQAIQSPRTVPFFLMVSLLGGYSLPNVLVKGIVAFKR